MNAPILAAWLVMLLGSMALHGCRPSSPKTESAPPAVPAPPAAAQAGRVPVEQQREVLEALRAAYSLEGRLWDERSRMRSREDLEQFFRQGFCDEPARLLSEHFWLGPGGPGDAVPGDAPPGDSGPLLRVGEPLLTLPEEPLVEEVGPEQARIRLDYPPVDTGPLTSPAQSVTVILRRQEGKWKVCAVESAGENPHPVPRHRR